MINSMSNISYATSPLPILSAALQRCMQPSAMILARAERWSRAASAARNRSMTSVVAGTVAKRGRPAIAIPSAAMHACRYAGCRPQSRATFTGKSQIRTDPLVDEHERLAQRLEFAHRPGEIPADGAVVAHLTPLFPTGNRVPGSALINRGKRGFPVIAPPSFTSAVPMWDNIPQYQCLIASRRALVAAIRFLQQARR